MEPVPANNGLLLQRHAFLDHLAAETRRAGALLIADEVICRVPPALRRITRRRERLQPDLVTLGKIIGGGMPIGAVAGRAALLEQLAPVGVGVPGGHPERQSVVGGGRRGHARCPDRPRGATPSWNAWAPPSKKRCEAAAPPGLQLIRSGSMLWPYYGTGHPRAAHQIADAAIERFNRAYAGFLERGLYLPPSGYEVAFLVHRPHRGGVPDAGRRAGGRRRVAIRRSRPGPVTPCPGNDRPRGTVRSGART